MARRRLVIVSALALIAGVVLAVVGLVGGSDSPGPGSGGPATSSPTTPTPTTSGPPAALPPAHDLLGINVNRLFNDGTYNLAQINAQIALLHSTGATTARSDAFWESSEPTAPVGGRHRYQWRFDDLVAGSLAAGGLSWLPIIDYSAPWAQSVAGRDHSPPASASDFAAYAAAVAARYGDGGAFWREHPQVPKHPVTTYEIWNEPDNPVFWGGAPDPSRYGDLYLRARAAIRRVAPLARVIVGGLTNPTSFIDAMVAADPAIKTHADGIAIHPYGPDPAAVLAKVTAARRTLVALGMSSTPLYITEFGWSTQPPEPLYYAPASLRPGYITSAFKALLDSGCGVAAAILYTWITPQHDPRNREDWFGISSAAATRTPDVAAFTAAMKAARAAKRQAALDC